MATSLRICLYDPSAPSDAERFFDQGANGNGSLRQHFEKLDGITVVEHCTDWNALQNHLRFGGLDAVAINLDSDTDGRYVSVQRIAEVAPECGIIGVSSSTDPDRIISAMRAGCTQFVRSPVDPADLRAAINRISQTRLSATTGCHQVALIGSAGGAGNHHNRL